MSGLPEIAPAAVDERMAEVQADVTRSLARRAQWTRNHLKENGFISENYEGNYSRVGLTGVDARSNDADLVKATIRLQMQVFPGDKTEWDGMYGIDTYKAYERAVPAKLDELRAIVQRARAERLQAEGEMVDHDRIADEIGAQYGITKEIIRLAQEEECHTACNADQIPQRKNLVRLADYAAQVTDVPTAAILAITDAELGNNFNPNDFGPVEELGMGQFVKKYWNEYQNHAIFTREMAKFTTQDPTKIGRARSMVADLLAIGIKLKESQRLPIVGEFGYNTRLTNEQLVAMRFHYHAPGYAAVYYGVADLGSEYKIRADAAYARYVGRYKSRFADKAEQLYTSLQPVLERIHG